MDHLNEPLKQIRGGLLERYTLLIPIVGHPQISCITRYSLHMSPYCLGVEVPWWILHSWNGVLLQLLHQLPRCRASHLVPKWQLRQHPQRRRRQPSTLGSSIYKAFTNASAMWISLNIPCLKSSTALALLCFVPGWTQVLRFKHIKCSENYLLWFQLLMFGG